MEIAMKLFQISAIAAGFLCALHSASAAHGIWVAERHSDHAVVYGHGSSDEGYEPKKLTSVTGKTADGSDVTVKIDRHDDHALLGIPDKTAVILAKFDNGYWSEGPDGKWHNKAKNEVQDAKQGGRYLKYAVSLLDKTVDSAKPHGLDFEIVPLRDPMTMKAGDELEVLVLLKGNPVADVTVIPEYTTDSDNKSIKTAADGKATITIRNQGINVIAASVDEDLSGDPKADKIGHFTTLSFNLHYHSE